MQCALSYFGSKLVFRIRIPPTASTNLCVRLIVNHILTKQSW